MKLYDLLRWFAQPVVRIALAILGPLGIVIGAVANPQGAVNGFLCRMIDVIASVWPSTPSSLKLSNLFASSDAASGIYGYLVSEIFSLALVCLSIVALVKLYKLIPFKMS